MARLLHDDSHHDHDHDHGHDCECHKCKKHRRHHGHHDWSGDCSGDWSGHRLCDSCDRDWDDCDCHKKRRRRRKHRKEKLIPVGRITVDCSPVVFRTPGQAMNIVSCAVTETLSVPVTRTTIIQQPAAFGCFECIPVTETIQVPVQVTVNVPPMLVPVPRTVCPPTVVQSNVVRSTGCRSCSW